MKKGKKTAMILGAAAGLSMLASTAAFAGEWKKDNVGWWYQYDATNYAVNTWIGNYYLGDRGYMLESQLTPDGYMVNDDGSWYVATPENAAEAYQKYRLYKYAALFDRTIPSVHFYEKDFNHDGILDMLTVTINSIEGMDLDSEAPTKIELLTIQNGKVEVVDQVNTSSEHTNDTWFVHYQQDDLVAQYGGDTVCEAYKINASLHFEAIPITNDQASSLWTSIVGGKSTPYYFYDLDFKSVDSNIVTGKCTGVEESHIVKY